MAKAEDWAGGNTSSLEEIDRLIANREAQEKSRPRNEVLEDAISILNEYYENVDRKTKGSYSLESARFADKQKVEKIGEVITELGHLKE